MAWVTTTEGRIEKAKDLHPRLAVTCGGMAVV